ncbi:PH domain-containing protein [Membranihabitans marinus]|uniref:PH domain-containing protein n=1 Tax=Membranihabitans marinus TaxID=1227546 RepID=UPI001F39679C|nr:PH domain-containing protein [Membranihabitans marinus]
MKNEIPFYNHFVNVEDLPQTGPDDFQPIESEYFYVKLASVFMFFIMSGFLLAMFVIFSDFDLYSKLYLLLGYLLVHILWAILVRLEFKQRGYAIREQDIAYRRGFIFRTRQYLPFRRVQHCKISEGLIERVFNFATIIVSAAGDDIVIQGLRPEVAQSLQSYINERVDALNKEMKNGSN